MVTEKASWLRRIRPYAIGLIVITALFLLGRYQESTPWGQTKKADTLQAYEAFVKAHPDDWHVAEAEKRIRTFKFGFRPKFFMIYEDKDLSGEIRDSSIAGSEEEAATLVYVKTREGGRVEYEGGHSGSTVYVTVRLVDKNTKRERTIQGTGYPPTQLKVNYSGDVRGSNGGRYVLDGTSYPGDYNGFGVLTQRVLEYAQTLESEKP